MFKIGSGAETVDRADRTGDGSPSGGEGQTSREAGAQSVESLCGLSRRPQTLSPRRDGRQPRARAGADPAEALVNAPHTPVGEP